MHDSVITRHQIETQTCVLLLRSGVNYIIKGSFKLKFLGPIYHKKDKIKLGFVYFGPFYKKTNSG